jgi:hypothetical protein
MKKGQQKNLARSIAREVQWNAIEAAVHQEGAKRVIAVVANQIEARYGAKPIIPLPWELPEVNFAVHPHGL